MLADLDGNQFLRPIGLLMPTPGQIRSHGIIRCQEAVIGPCATATEGCCGVVNCGYCLRLWGPPEEEGGDEVLIGAGLAPYNDGTYHGVVLGHTFDGAWSRDYDDGECVFTITIDEGTGAAQVFEYTCYDKPCRGVEGEADVPEGRLEWKPVRTIPLARRDVYGCLFPFCIGCECIPEFVCVTVSGEECTNRRVFAFSGGKNDCGEAETVEYEFSLDCGETTVEGVVSLHRDEYTDECILTITGEGDYVGTSMVSGCSISGSATLSVGGESFTVSVTEAPCEFCEPEVNALCCPDPIPTTLYLSGGLIPEGVIVPLSCNNCDPETAANYVERTFSGSFTTDPLLNISYGSGGDAIFYFFHRLRVTAEYSCGSGFRLTLAARIGSDFEVFQTENPGLVAGATRVILPPGEFQSTDTEVVFESCDPIFNAYIGAHQLAVQIAPGEPQYPVPQDYYVTE